MLSSDRIIVGQRTYRRPLTVKRDDSDDEESYHSEGASEVTSGSDSDESSAGSDENSDAE